MKWKVNCFLERSQLCARSSPLRRWRHLNPFRSAALPAALAKAGPREPPALANVWARLAPFSQPTSAWASHWTFSTRCTWEVLKHYCWPVLVLLIQTDVWRTGETPAEARLIACVYRCRQDIFVWDAQQRRNFPKKRILRMSEAVIQMLTCMRNSPWKLSHRQHQTLVDLAKRATVLAEPAGVPKSPKFHLMLHIAHRAGHKGNPYAYHTFLDEDYIGRLAKVA